jgi:flagellar biosynthesis regulator FlbT
MSKILLWLQERIKLWTKPAISVLIIGALSDLTRNRTCMVVENAIVMPTNDRVESTDQTATPNQPCYFEKQIELNLHI